MSGSCEPGCNAGLGDAVSRSCLPCHSFHAHAAGHWLFSRQAAAASELPRQARLQVPTAGGPRLARPHLVQLLVLRPGGLEALLGAEGRQVLLQAQLQAAGQQRTAASAVLGGGRRHRAAPHQRGHCSLAGCWQVAHDSCSTPEPASASCTMLLAYDARAMRTRVMAYRSGQQLASLGWR